MLDKTKQKHVLNALQICAGDLDPKLVEAMPSQVIIGEFDAKKSTAGKNAGRQSQSLHMIYSQNDSHPDGIQTCAMIARDGSQMTSLKLSLIHI